MAGALSTYVECATRHWTVTFWAPSDVVYDAVTQSYFVVLPAEYRIRTELSWTSSRARQVEGGSATKKSGCSSDVADVAP